MLVLTGDVIEFAENLHTSLHLVINLLGNEQLDAIFIVVTEHLHEVVGLVVLTTEAQHQNGTCIGVEADVAEHLAGVLVVARELRTAEVVMPGVDGVDTFLTGLFLEGIHQTFGDAVHTAHSRYNPYFVSHTDITVLADITLKGSVFFFDVKLLVYRIICVFECA